MEQLRKNDIIELEITATGSGGEGIGRHNGLAVFVPAAACGDKLEVKIVKVEKRLAYGRIEKILSPAICRISPDCDVFPKCGGCAFRHISYEAECEAKNQRVADAFKRIGGIDLAPEEFICADEIEGYRNKAQLPCRDGDDGIVFGFFAERSHRVIESKRCFLQPEGFERIAEAVKLYVKKSGCTAYDEITHRGLLRHLYIRRSRANGETMVCLVANGSSLPKEDLLIELLLGCGENISGIILNENRERTNVILGAKCRTLWGRDCIYDSLLGVEFKISPLSFFQINPAQAEKLYARAALYAQLKDTDTLLDLYCGAGTIGLTMAGKVKNLIGVEVVPEAIEDAKENAKHNNIDNAEFICADAAKAALMLKERGIKPDVVCLDPPRKGCSRELLETVAQMSPERIVYVSCDCATLARDCAVLKELGYEAKRLSAVDMFPRTKHVEAVCQLLRSDINS